MCWEHDLVDFDDAPGGCAGRASGCDIGGRRGAEKQGTLRSHLGQLGIPVSDGHDPAHVSPGTTAVVFSNAMPTGHPELAAARRAGLPVLRRHQALGQYAR